MKALTILYDSKDDKLEYVCYTLFSHLCKIEYQLFPVGEYSYKEGERGLIFSVEQTNVTDFIWCNKKSDNTLHKPCSYSTLIDDTQLINWLSKSDLIRVIWNFLTLDYAETDFAGLDNIGRVQSSQIFNFYSDWQNIPWIDQFLRSLFGAMKMDCKFLVNETKLLLTIDIDIPYVIQNRSITSVIKTFVKQIVTGNISSFLSLLTMFLGFRNDAFNTYSEILTLLPPNQIRFFALLASNHKLDNPIKAKSKAWNNLLKVLADHQVLQLHPGYSSQSLANINEEKSSLENIINYPITEVRMHYLRINNRTRLNLSKLGITKDFTTCIADGVGFPNGTVYPYPHYHSWAIGRELILVPTMAMDRTLLSYNGLSIHQAVDQLDNLYSTTRHYGGTFGLLLHNNTLSNFGEWKNWKAPLIEWIKRKN